LRPDWNSENMKILYYPLLAVLSLIPLGIFAHQKAHKPHLVTPTIIYAVEFAEGNRRITATANTKNLAEITPEVDRRVWWEMGKKYQAWGQWQDAKECFRLAKKQRKSIPSTGESEKKDGKNK